MLLSSEDGQTILAGKQLPGKNAHNDEKDTVLSFMRSRSHCKNSAFRITRWDNPKIGAEERT